jgi:hypothetical protein
MIVVDICSNAITSTDIYTDNLVAIDISTDKITVIDICSNAITSTDIYTDNLMTIDISTDKITVIDICSNTITSSDIIADKIITNDISTGDICANTLFSDATISVDISCDTLVVLDICSNTLIVTDISTNTITVIDITSHVLVTSHIYSDTILVTDISCTNITIGEVVDITFDDICNNLLVVNGANQVILTDDGAGWTIPSDKRLKTNIVKIDDSLDKINKINGYTYNLINQSRQHLGVIAQEVNEIFPEVISYNNEYMSVNYSELIPVLINSINALNNKVTLLENVIKDLHGSR